MMDAEEIQRAFAPQAEAYRTYKRRLTICGIGFLGTLLTIGVLEPPLPVAYALGVVAASFWAAGVLVEIRSPALTCPACEHGLDRAVDVYCPQCGQGGVRHDSGLFGRTRCAACRATLVSGKRGRFWKIGYCTFCGALLTSTGV